LPTFQQALDEDFAPTWHEALGSRLILGTAPQGAWQIRVVDDMPECWICSGYHAFDGTAPFAVISMMDDWQLTFTHELWEILVNPYANRTAKVKFKKKQTRLYAMETSDPVESDKFSYTRVSPTGQTVQISDFLTPAWFRRGSGGPWDFTRSTSRPLQVLEDGYQLFRRNGGWDAIYASKEAKEDGLSKAASWTARLHRGVFGTS
jgi:hypothetical protein